MFRAAAFATICACAGGLLQAQSISVAVTDPNGMRLEALEQKLFGASLSASLRDDAGARTSDYLASAKADYRRMVRALYDEGFYAGEVSIKIDGREAADVPLSTDMAQINAIAISVATGPEFQFGRVSISPDRVQQTAAKSGDVAKATALSEARDEIRAAWRARGYAKAALVSQRITARHADHTLNADLEFEPGPKLRFGHLSAAGETKMSTDRVRAISGLPYGTVFDPEDLKIATNRLRRTGVFSTVILREADRWNADYTLPISAELTERKPRRIGASMEYSTTEGLTARGYWLHRNLLGGAERFKADLSLTDIGLRDNPIDATLALSLERPATWTPDNALKMHLELSRKDDPGAYSEKLDAYIGLDRIVNHHFKLEAGLGIVAGNHRDQNGTRKYHLLTLPLLASDDRRDDPGSPSRGYYIQAKATPFWSTEGVRGVRISGDLRAYASFGERITLAGRLQMGSVIGSSADRTPPEFLFFSGGGGTVRGQRYRSLGIAQSDGTLRGGLSHLGTQLELRARLGEKLGAVGFADFGLIGDTSNPLRSTNWHGGAGLGVRYETKIGMIRLDVATPITGNKKLKTARIYVGIGQAF